MDRHYGHRNVVFRPHDQAEPLARTELEIGLDQEQVLFFGSDMWREPYTISADRE